MNRLRRQTRAPLPPLFLCPDQPPPRRLRAVRRPVCFRLRLFKMESHMTGTVLTWTTWIPTMWMIQTTSCPMRYHLLNLRVAVRRFDAMTPRASISFAGIGCAEAEVRDRLRPGLLERGRDLGGHAQAHILIQRKQLFKVTNTLPA